MKKWKVRFTLDKEMYQIDIVEAETFTEAYVRMMLRHNGAIITNITEM